MCSWDAELPAAPVAGASAACVREADLAHDFKTILWFSTALLPIWPGSAQSFWFLLHAQVILPVFCKAPFFFSQCLSHAFLLFNKIFFPTN